MYLLSFNVPESHLDIVKNAVYAAGAGSAENYSHCCWQTKGQGQFMPLPGSNPFIGKINQLETVDEYQVMSICAEEDIKKVVAALKQAHPYETPYYIVLKIEDY